MRQAMFVVLQAGLVVIVEIVNKFKEIVEGDHGPSDPKNNGLLTVSLTANVDGQLCRAANGFPCRKANRELAVRKNVPKPISSPSRLKKIREMRSSVEYYPVEYGLNPCLTTYKNE